MSEIHVMDVPNDAVLVEVDQSQFATLRRLCASELIVYMRERGIDGVYLADDPNVRIVA